MAPNSIIRKNARAQLDNNVFSSVWLMLLVVYLVYSGIVGTAGAISCGIALFVLTGPITFGLNRICVGLVRGKKEIKLEELFVGFKECFTESFLLSLMMEIFTFLWSLLFFIPGIVKSYSYAMAPYILQDDPSKDWQEALNESKRMMEGHRWQLFCLDLSLLGWHILGFLCCCVGTFFVYPYALMVRANFYMALKAFYEPEISEAESSDGAEQADPLA